MFLKGRYEKNPTKSANVGSREKTEYIMKVDKTGHKYLVEAGTTNIYEKIQAHKDECNINNIMAKALRGDYSGLNFNVIAADLTNMPETVHEYQNISLAVDQLWNKLDIEIRRAYNFDKDQLLADWGTDNFNKIMGISKTIEPIEKKEVTAEE